jgi:hypothetical protein
MGHEPQTNEVRRSICLVGGFLEVAKATGLPLRCFEIAASAGLNLSWDRYRYRLGDAAWGDPRRASSWTPTGRDRRRHRTPGLGDRAGRLRPPARPISPIPTSAGACWPTSGPTRPTGWRASARPSTCAWRSGVTVEQADAVDWTRARVAPQAGRRTVLYHSVFWQYMPAQSQKALAALIATIGARRRAERALRLAPHGARTREHAGHAGAPDALAGRRGTGAGRGPSARRLGPLAGA